MKKAGLTPCADINQQTEIMTIYTDKIHINLGGTTALIVLDKEQTDVFEIAAARYNEFFAVEIDNGVTVRRYFKDGTRDPLLIFAASAFYMTSDTLTDKFRIYQ